MDGLKWGAAALLLAAFVGSLVVRDQPASLAATLPLPPICGSMAGDHGGTSMQAHLDMMSANADPAHAALYQTMEPMHSDMMAGMTAPDFEVAFMCGMIPHHQGAIAMAEVARQYASDSFIQMMAQEIISAQQTEITEMQAWLGRKAAALPALQ